MTISFSSIEDAFFFVSCQPLGMNEAFLSLVTGKFYYLSAYGDSDELPDDIEDSDQYLEIPHKNQLDQGRNLVDAFTAEHARQLTDAVFDIFQRRGAYRNFKDLMAENGLLENCTNTKPTLNIERSNNGVRKTISLSRTRVTNDDMDRSASRHQCRMILNNSLEAEAPNSNSPSQPIIQHRHLT